MPTINVPQQIIDKINKDAAKYGFNSKRIDSPKSRWKYVMTALCYADIVNSANQL